MAATKRRHGPLHPVDCRAVLSEEPELAKETDRRPRRRVGHVTHGRHDEVVGGLVELHDDVAGGPDQRHPRIGKLPGAGRVAFQTSSTLSGMGRVDGWLDPVGFAEFAEGLHRIEQEMFDGDWQQARAAHGSRTTVELLWRSPAQRRADALVEMRPTIDDGPPRTGSDPARW